VTGNKNFDLSSMRGSKRMKQSKVKVMVGMLALCALVMLSLPVDAYAFPAKDVPVLMYHKVDDETPSTYWVSTTDFREQMFLLHDLGYETVDCNALYYHVMGVAEMPNKPVIVTLDDAYQNAYTHALPVLNELSDPAFFGQAHIGPTDYISDDEPNRQENLWDQPKEAAAWHMIWPEVNELYNTGWAIVAHSQTHLNMNDAGYDIAREVNSCDVIVLKAGIPTPNFYCYPFGQSSAALIAALKAKGYLGAMDASGGIENTSRLEADTNNLFHIKRMGVMREDTLAQFAASLGETLPTIYRLTANVDNGGGSVRMNPDRPFYYYSDIVTATAVPAPFFTFVSWSGDLTGSNNPDTITMDSDKTVTASFVFDGIELFNDGFEGTPWDANWNDNGVTAWMQDDAQQHSGSYSALAGIGQGGYLTSDDLDATDVDAVYVDFWFRKKNTDAADLILYYYNGTDYDEIADLDGLGGYNVWVHYTDIITDSNYLNASFRIRFDAALAGGENVWIDDVVIEEAIAAECDAANLDGAGIINFKDFAILVNDWQLAGSGLAGDIDVNDVVNFGDLDWMLDYWLIDCGQP